MHEETQSQAEEQGNKGIELENHIKVHANGETQENQSNFAIASQELCHASQTPRWQKWAADAPNATFQTSKSNFFRSRAEPDK
jgi:hypothetical protein